MTGPTYQYIIDQRYADPADPEVYEYGAEEEEEYGEEGEEEYGDYGEEEPSLVETVEWPKQDAVPHVPVEDRFFIGEKSRETLRKNYSEIEIGAFMKVLNVKPHAQWQDETTHHYKLGVHDYEDEAQELDPQFHLLSEEERKAAELQRVKEWRSGHEIKIETKDKKPRRYDYRFWDTI